jgi:hypothetical protein
MVFHIKTFLTCLLLQIIINKFLINTPRPLGGNILYFIFQKKGGVQKEKEKREYNFNLLGIGIQNGSKSKRFKIDTITIIKFTIKFDPH